MELYFNLIPLRLLKNFTFFVGTDYVKLLDSTL